ncbi:MAG TPA: hypothetical protein VMN36_03665 [Verrucomicrobiales bacterium]|nr:hypothetical protein [Verrucomicrobiales bacterium]
MPAPGAFAPQEALLMAPGLPNSLTGPSNREHQLPPSARPQRGFAIASASVPLLAALFLSIAWFLHPAPLDLPGQLAPPEPVRRLPESGFGTFFWSLATLALTLAGPLFLLCGLARPEQGKALLMALIINLIWIFSFVVLSLPLVR